MGMKRPRGTTLPIEKQYEVAKMIEHTRRADKTIAWKLGVSTFEVYVIRQKFFTQELRWKENIPHDDQLSLWHPWELPLQPKNK